MVTHDLFIFYSQTPASEVITNGVLVVSKEWVWDCVGLWSRRLAEFVIPRGKTLSPSLEGRCTKETRNKKPA